MSRPRPHRGARAALALLALVTLSACADEAPDIAAAEQDEPPEVALRAQRFDRGIVYGHIRDADVFVVHGINGRDLDLAESLPVDVEIDGRCAIPNLQFREIRGPLALPAGSYDIRVRLAAATPCSGTAVISVDDATLVAGTNVSIVAHLSATGQPTASIFANDLEGGPSSGTIAARHVAAFGPVDVAVGNERLFTNVRNGQGGLAAVEAGDARVRVFAAGGRRAAFKGRTVFTPEFLNVFYAVGTPSRGTFEVLHQEIFLFGRDAARVALVHGINGRDLNLPEALPVDVEVNGICAEPNFRFRTITASRPLAAGTYTVRVRLADAARPCSGTAVITAEGVRVERGTYVSIAAHLSAAGAPTASVFRDDLVTRQQATLAARHVANFGAVDVLLNGRVAFAGVRNGQGGAAAAPVGRQRVAIAAAGSPTPALEAEPALAGAPFVNVLWAVGTPANGTFEVLAQRVAILF